MYHCFVVCVSVICPSLKIAKHPRRRPRQHRIRHVEKYAEKRHRHRHHHRLRPHVRPRRPVHLLHFHTRLMQELLQPLRVRRDLADRPRNRKRLSRACLFVIHFPRPCHLSCVLAPPVSFSFRSPAPSKLAGEEGFEPPHPVLETGGLPLNLLPFTLRTQFEGFTLRQVYARNFVQILLPSGTLFRVFISHPANLSFLVRPRLLISFSRSRAAFEDPPGRSLHINSTGRCLVVPLDSLRHISCDAGIKRTVAASNHVARPDSVASHGSNPNRGAQ